MVQPNGYSNTSQITTEFILIWTSNLRCKQLQGLFVTKYARNQGLYHLPKWTLQRDSGRLNKRGHGGGLYKYESYTLR